MYIEAKSGTQKDLPARIGRVTYSKTGKTIYYNGKAFQSLKGSGISGNYYETESGDEYWISGCKKNGQDRHYSEPGKVEIDEDVKEEYFQAIRTKGT